MYIGVDLGGTNIAVGIVDDNGNIIEKGSVKTLKERPTDEIVFDMARLSKELLKKTGIEMSQIKAIGIGCPGTINVETGEVVYSNNIPMEHYMMADKLKEYTGKAVYIDNDANCAALGEYAVNGQGAKTFVLVTLGTGVGGGVILDGKVMHGFNFAGGELGHMTLVSGGKKCTCGKEGCLEVYASATALIEQTQEAITKNPDSLMAQLAKDNGGVTGRTAFDAMNKGDAAAKAVVEQYARYLADGLVSFENIFQPEIIAIGGGVSNAGEALFEPVREYIDKVRFNKFMPKTKVVKALLGNDAGIIGAAMVARAADV
ncbi:MAG: ROK family glucokinase [Clostridia bacterium]|nr:ROK family glucokinase [Clostridia bacterium]